MTVTTGENDASDSESSAPLPPSSLASVAFAGACLTSLAVTFLVVVLQEVASGWRWW